MIRVLARHAGDTILKYVRDAPPATINVDLGIAARGQQVATSTAPDPRLR